MKLNLFGFGTAAGVLTSATPVNALAANNMDADESGSLDCLGDLMEEITDEITQSCTGGRGGSPVDVWINSDVLDVPPLRGVRQSVFLSDLTIDALKCLLGIDPFFAPDCDDLR